MKGFGKNRRGFIGIALNGGDVFMAVNMAEKRVFPKIAKRESDALKVIIAQLLVGKGDDFIFQPNGAQFSGQIG